MSSSAPSSTSSAWHPGSTVPTVNGDPGAVQGPEWKDPLQEWQTVCAAGLWNVTDACCAAQNGSVWVDNSTTFNGPGQHQCLIYTTNKTNANVSREAFYKCASRRAAQGLGGAISMCYTKDSSARRVAIGVVGLVWVAAGCVLVL
ncbi:uncharacterized protein LOC62_01G000156 [Vanrija pseudolonga]|uniref:Uncharacterized protein n=1 Tax=Vanrija pseudolonga TaxID=143232 RepID=A0AAF1BHZ9_9TREE|nr:hypothetical protein LOC62_01G000156 [Vanrija pseudolonga]